MIQQYTEYKTAVVLFPSLLKYPTTHIRSMIFPVFPLLNLGRFVLYSRPGVYPGSSQVGREDVPENAELAPGELERC